MNAEAEDACKFPAPKTATNEIYMSDIKALVIFITAQERVFSFLMMLFFYLNMLYYKGGTSYGKSNDQF